ncbi:MAG: deiodinase-like protein [Planctomycetota bacterium]
MRPFPFLLEAADADRDGVLSLAELLGWRTGMQDREARAAARAAAKAPAAAPAAPPTAGAAPSTAAVPASPPPAAANAADPKRAAPARPRRPEAPAVGSVAPDFTLRSRGGATTRTLSDLRGTPVVLIFGSYTCPPFRASAGWIRAAYDRHAADARFLFVYVREAHAIDGRAPMPEPGQPVVEEPATFEDRRAVADVCALDLRFGVFETLVDGLDDAVARAYVAPPARLYVVGRDGKIVYRSEPGPFGLKQREFDDAVRRAVAPAP